MTNGTKKRVTPYEKLKYAKILTTEYIGKHGIKRQLNSKTRVLSSGISAVLQLAKPMVTGDTYAREWEKELIQKKKKQKTTNHNFSPVSKIKSKVEN